jgi:hypothetical protein
MRFRVFAVFLFLFFVLSTSCSSPDYSGWKCKLDDDCVDVSAWVCNSLTRSCVKRLGHGQQSCQTAHDCAEGHFCDQPTKTCFLPGAPGSVAAGGSCRNNLDCEANLGCFPEPQHGQLQCGHPNGVTAICREDMDCEAPLRCESSTCRAPLGTPCASAASCPEGAACRPDDSKLLRCLPKAPPGTPCRGPGDCALGQCSSATARCPGQDGSSCVSEADCLAPNACVPVGAERLCKPPVSVCERCDTDTDCAAGLCRSGLCVSTLSGACTSDACCPTRSVCVPDGTSALRCQSIGMSPGAPCLLDAHCGPDLTCWQGKECRYRIGKGPCSSAAACAGTPPVCLLRQCIEPGSEKEPCVEPDGTVVPEACKPGLLCGATHCVKPGTLKEGTRCRSDLECEPLLVCSGGSCKR